MHEAPDVVQRRTSAAEHPKDALYDLVYDPLTVAWFAALRQSPDRRTLLESAAGRDLLDNLHRFNSLFHHLVDVSISVRHGDLPIMVATLRQHRETVHWGGYLAGAPDADVDDAEIVEFLARKMKRNVSMGAIEALICLESAYAYCVDQLRLPGRAILATLRDSRRLYSSLASLHDEQEMVRLTFLTGIEGYLAYPEHDYSDVLEGRLAIPAHRFVSSRHRGAWRLRFVATSVSEIELTSPKKMCPAHRHTVPENDGRTLNDVLWDLLLEIYLASGRFD
jgi:hypothetical protein